MTTQPSIVLHVTRAKFRHGAGTLEGVVEEFDGSKVVIRVDGAPGTEPKRYTRRLTLVEILEEPPATP